MITTQHQAHLVEFAVLGEFTLADFKEFEELVLYEIKFSGAVDLLVEHRRVDDSAAVRGRQVIAHSDATGDKIDLDARQMRGQRLATGTNAWGAWFRFRNRRFQFRLNRRQILVAILFEQATLHGGERFILDAEADALEVRQLKGEFLDFDFFEVSICLVRRALSRLIDHVTSLGQQGWIKVQSGEFGKQIHGRNYTTAPF